MRRNLANQFEYPFTWLDEAIEVTLNPKKNSPAGLKKEELRLMEKRFEEETRKVINALKSLTFSLFTVDEIKTAAGQYHLAIQILLLQAKTNADGYPDQPPIQHTSNLIIAVLEDLKMDVLKRYSVYLPDPPITDSLSSPQLSSLSFKLLCQLSADQIAILLKAADDTKLVIAKSLSIVFKTIVPFLSTNNHQSLSWDSMRSRSYHPEENDKATAISALEKMIAAIKSYH